MRARILRGTATATALLGLAVTTAGPATATPPGRAAVDWTNARITLPWTAAPLSESTACPGGRLKFTALGDATPDVGTATRGGFTYYVHVLDAADVTRDGGTDTVLRLACNDGRDHMGWLYLYSASHRRPVLLDFVTSSEENVNAEYAVLAVDARPGAVEVVEFVRGLPELVTRTFTWDGDELVADQPLPQHPEADAAP